LDVTSEFGQLIGGYLELRDGAAGQANGKLRKSEHRRNRQVFGAGNVDAYFGLKVCRVV
jgi:hypothetical protein